MQLKGEGFHRQLRTELGLASQKRLIDCRVSYYFKIPREAYVDVDALNNTLLNAHCFLSSGSFDTEAAAFDARLASTPQRHPLIFQSREQLRKVFVWQNTLEFPLHLRYQRSTDDESSKHSFGQLQQFLGFLALSDHILIEPPQIFVHCADNKTLMEEKSCRAAVKKVQSAV